MMRAERAPKTTQRPRKLLRNVFSVMAKVRRLRVLGRRSASVRVAGSLTKGMRHACNVLVTPSKLKTAMRRCALRAQVALYHRLDR